MRTDDQDPALSDGVHDGRRLRAVRNREHVVEAILDLFDEGVVDFDAATLAERAGVSVRSVYRYFEDREALVLAGVSQHAERLNEWLHYEFDVTEDLPTRVEDFLAYRLEVYGQVETVVEVARHYARSIEVVGEALESRRNMAREQLTEVFAPELAAADASTRTELVAALDAATDLDTWRLLRDAHGLDEPSIRRVMKRVVLAVFDGTRPENS